MTETPPSDPMDDAPTLPGLELAQPSTGMSELERQIRRSIERLEATRVIGVEHAGQAQLAIELAATIGRSRGAAAYGIAQAAAQLNDVMTTLNPPTEGGPSDDDFTRWKRELHELDAARGRPALRDPS